MSSPPLTELSIETPTHGKVLVRGAADATRLVVGFHGYAQTAPIMLEDLERLRGGRPWALASVQGLHRFYTRDNKTVLASWMTRENREEAIADNLAYVDRAIAAIRRSLAVDGSIAAGTPLVLLGFSQGAAMAYRAALAGRHATAGVVVLGGDIPPELKTPHMMAEPAPAGGVAMPQMARGWPPVLIGAGDREHWYTPPKVEADAAFLESHRVPHRLVRFSGGHEWTDAFRDAAADWIDQLKP